MRSLKVRAGMCVLAATATLAFTGTAQARVTMAASSGHFTGTLANGTVWIADVPANWNDTLLLYSHGFGPLTAADAPDPDTQAALLGRGYALAGSSYDPNGSEWALDTAVSDQFGTLRAVEGTALPGRPRQVLALGTSMGGLVSALEAQDGAGRINGALTTCGIVAGGINLNEYQLDGEYALAQLLTSVPAGHLTVPELDLHTIGDNLVPVQMENFYARQVGAAGHGSLLRQAFAASFGHCNFSPAELVAGVLALSHRVSTGHWDQVADPGRLNQVASGLDLGAAQFAGDYYPGSLTGAAGLSRPWPGRH
jgi:hypothetical protein